VSAPRAILQPAEAASLEALLAGPALHARLGWDAPQPTPPPLTEASQIADVAIWRRLGRRVWSGTWGIVTSSVAGGSHAAETASLPSLISRWGIPGLAGRSCVAHRHRAPGRVTQEQASYLAELNPAAAFAIAGRGGPVASAVAVMPCPPPVINAQEAAA
jgi:hypothetical protein